MVSCYVAISRCVVDMLNGHKWQCWLRLLLRELMNFTKWDDEI